jgi:hypothetical protein
MCECGHGLGTFGMHLIYGPFGGQQIATHDVIQNVMYAFVWKSGHAVWRKRWYALTLGVSLQTALCMTWKDYVFVTNVVVTDLMRKTMALSVINWPTCVIAELNTIVKIHKYRGLHEEHHFIQMAMEVHNKPRRDMNCFIRECAYLFHDRQSRGHLTLSFCIQFFK